MLPPMPALAVMVQVSPGAPAAWFTRPEAASAPQHRRKDEQDRQQNPCERRLVTVPPHSLRLMVAVCARGFKSRRQPGVVDARPARERRALPGLATPIGDGGMLLLSRRSRKIGGPNEVAAVPLADRDRHDTAPGLAVGGGAPQIALAGDTSRPSASRSGDSSRCARSAASQNPAR